MNLTELFQNQIENWPLAKENYAKLTNIKTKEFDLDGYIVRVIYNPARAVSSFAKTDAKSIAERPCFLCGKNRPKEQIGINFQNKYSILVNPYPICPVHFTVALEEHEPQRIEGHMSDMLKLAIENVGYIVLFNGAKSGASAPDHMHFQIVKSDFFIEPINKPCKYINKFTITSDNASEIDKWIREIWKTYPEEKNNIFCSFGNGGWTMTVFPRNMHRPRQFFSEELLISPGAIDMTGNLIVAREEDFKKITKESLIDIFEQVSAK